MNATSQLDTYNFEISWGARWIDLNDDENYKIHAESGANKQRSYRQIKTTSPVVEGDFLIHAVPEMVVEQVKIKVYGQDMADFEDNMQALVELFEQFSFTIRETKNNHRAYWQCQMASAINIEAGHIFMHNLMGVFTASVPRYPTISRERIDL